MNRHDDKERVEMIALTENALMRKACVFAAYGNGSSAHSFRTSNLTIITLPFLFRGQQVLRERRCTWFCDVIQIVWYDLLLCLLELRGSKNVNWLPYGCTDPVCLGWDFWTWQVFDVPLLRTKKRYRKGSAAVVDIPTRGAQ